MLDCDFKRHSKKVKFNYFIVRPKVDQRAGQLSLPFWTGLGSCRSC